MTTDNRDHLMEAYRWVDCNDNTKEYCSDLYAVVAVVTENDGSITWEIRNRRTRDILGAGGMQFPDGVKPADLGVIENMVHGTVWRMLARAENVMMPYSPGPWRLQRATMDYALWYVVTNDHRLSATQDRLTTVAKVDEQITVKDPSRNLSHVQSIVERNAKLIAAAPDLLEAAEHVLQRARDKCMPPLSTDLGLERLESAVTRAIGY